MKRFINGDLLNEIMKTLKNYLVSGMIGLASFGIFGSEGYGQSERRDAIFNIGNKLDSLQDLATENYNRTKINFNKCILEEKNDLPCFNIILKYLPLSKKALEEYISFFEKNKIYEDSTFV